MLKIIDILVISMIFYSLDAKSIWEINEKLKNPSVYGDMSKKCRTSKKLGEFQF